MTSIRPPAYPSFLPDRAAQPLANTPAAEPDFATLLGRSLEDGRDSGLPSGKDATVAAAIAHVFNAFGFFPASTGEGTRVPSEEKAALESAQQPAASSMANILPQNLRPEGPTDQLAPIASAEGVPVSPSAPAASLPAGISEPSPDGESLPGKQLIDSHLGKVRSRMNEISVPGVKDLVRQERPSRPNAGLEPRRTSEGETNEVETGPDVPAPRDPASHVHNQRDRLVFRIGAHLVELIARLEGLSEEDEQRLIDALNDILEAHGLSLGPATLNGQPIDHGVFGGQG